MSRSLPEYIAAHEGVVDHLYLDTRGNITCGVGQLLRKPVELCHFTWTDFPAALQDFMVLQQMARDCKYGKKWPATRYAPLVRSRMTKPYEGLTETIERLDGALERRTGWFSKLPQPAQWAVIDMCFNLGLDGFLKGFPKMVDALAAGDMETAAQESHRNGIGDARNEETAALLRKKRL